MTILSTRLHQPATCSDAIVRTRLFKQLDESLSHKLTLISAPAGFGKSTLVTSWLDQRAADAEAEAGGSRIAWVSADPADNDSYTFFGTLVAAIEGAFPDTCTGTQALLDSGHVRSWSHLVTSLSQATERLPAPLLIVIDDYYLITNAGVHEAMSQFIRTSSTSVHLVIVTRVDPALGLTQLRARKQLVEIRGRDLQFLPDEARAFLQQAIPADTQAFDSLLHVLHDRNEGWAVGLRLAAVSMQQRAGIADMNAFVRDFERNGNRYIVDYLVDEVLQAQPPEMQTFLLCTCVLPRMCAPLCAAVAGEGGAFDARACQMLLEQLEQRNLFVVNLDDHRGWYRYHHQFQAMLLNRLRMQFTAAQEHQLRRRSAEWLAANGHPDEAIGEYVALGELECAAQLIEDNLTVLENDEQWQRLSRWLAQIPEGVVNQRPGLLIALGWVKRLSYADHDVKGLVARVEHQLQAADESERSRWQAQLLALKSTRGVNASEETRREVARQARGLARPEQIWVRANALMNEVFAEEAGGNLARALDLLDRALEDPDFSNGKNRASLHRTAALVHYFEGDLSNMRWHAQRCRYYAVQHHMLMSASYGDCMEGLAHFHRNDLDAAERHFRAVFDMRFVAMNHAVALSAHGLLCILAGRGDMEAAQRVVQGMRDVESSEGIGAATRLSEALAARLALAQGDLPAALRWAHAVVPEPHKGIQPNDPELAILIEILIAQDTPDSLARAQTILAVALECSQGEFDHRAANEGLVRLARVRDAQGCHGEALDALATAAAFAQPRGCVRWFVEGGDCVREMLVELARSGRHTIEANALLADMAHSPGQQTIGNPRPVQLDLLSQRETDVLALLAARLSNKEIAAKLVISPKTVRNHTSNIYSKLRVATRMQAVHEARARGLL